MEKIKQYEDLIMKLEHELGSTVQKLEMQREKQEKQAEATNRDLLRVCEHRRELKAKLELTEDKLQAAKIDLATRLEQWQAERNTMEQRLAAALASKDAAIESEKRLLDKVAALDAKVAASTMHYKALEDTKKLNGELQERIESQTDQISKLREKLAQVTEQLKEKAKEDTSTQSDVQFLKEQNELLTRQLDRLHTDTESLDQVAMQLKAEQERRISIQESLASMKRLNETQAEQIEGLRRSQELEQRRGKHLESAHAEQVAVLRKQLEEAHKAFNNLEQERQREQKLARERAAADVAGKGAAPHTSEVTKQLQRLEASFRSTDTLDTSTMSGSHHPRLATWSPAVEPNRVIAKVLSDSKRHEERPEESSISATQRFAIPDVFEMLNETLYGDQDQTRAVSDLVARALDSQSDDEESFENVKNRQNRSIHSESVSKKHPATSRNTRTESYTKPEPFAATATRGKQLKAVKRTQHVSRGGEMNVQERPGANTIRIPTARSHKKSSLTKTKTKTRLSSRSRTQAETSDRPLNTTTMRRTLQPKQASVSPSHRGHAKVTKKKKKKSTGESGQAPMTITVPRWQPRAPPVLSSSASSATAASMAHRWKV